MRIIYTSLLVISFLAWSAPGCKQKVRSYLPTPTLIEGWIRDAGSENIEIFLEEKGDARCKSHPDGHFLLTPTLSESGIYHLQIGNTQTIELFIIPGKRIQFTFEMQKKDSIPHFAGDLANENNYLAEYYTQKAGNLWPETDSIQLMEEPDFTANVEEFTNQILSYQQGWQQEKGAFDSDFASIMSEELTFLSARLKLEFAIDKTKINHITHSLTDTYDSFLQNIEIESNNHLMVPSYPSFLYSYVNYRLAQDTTMRSLSKVEGLLQTAMSTFQSPEIRDVAYFMILSNGMRTELNETSRLIPVWLQKFKNPYFIAKVNSIKEDFKYLEPGYKIVDFALESIRGGKMSLAKFKEKTVLLVVWESVSSTSLREINILEEKLKTLKPGRNTEILYLSVDEDKTAWKNIVRKNKIHGNHAYIKPEERKLFLSHYHIERLPAFLLIGKDGIILNATAPFPSSGKLEKELQGL